MRSIPLTVSRGLPPMTGLMFVAVDDIGNCRRTTQGGGTAHRRNINILRRTGRYAGKNKVKLAVTPSEEEG